MENAALLYSVLTVALLSSATAVLAVLAWLLALRSTRARKPPPPSLEASFDGLNSALSAEKISHQLAKLENRLRMREVRSFKDAPAAPREGSSKADLFRHYGFSQVGPKFAQRQLELERAQSLNGAHAP